MIRELARRAFGRRWAVVLVHPATAEFPAIRSPWAKGLTYGEALNRLPIDERNPSVETAALMEGAWLEVAWISRHGFV